MVYSATQDMTAAWYAAAPPPPPPPSASLKANKRASTAPSYGIGHPIDVDGYGAKPGLRTSSSSQSFHFDRRAAGDSLPADTYAPEPERPVSRNAMARARERERQRTRTNSTSGYSAPNGEPMYMTSTMLQTGAAAQPTRSPSPGPRARRESSPASAESWNGHAQQQQQQYYHQHPAYQASQQQHSHAAYTAQPPAVHGYSAPPTPVSTVYAPSPVATAPQNLWQASGYASQQQQFQQAPPHASATDYHHAGYVAPGQPNAGPQHAVYAAAPGHPGYASAPQTPIQAQPWQQQHAQQPMTTYAPVVNGWAQPMVANGPQQQAPSGVPFPSAAMPPPPVPMQHPYMAHGTPPIATTSVQGRPLPSPAPSSRSSSQSSSVGTRNSVASLGSVSGTVRRSLPQPPPPAGQGQRYDSQPSTPSQHSVASSVRTTSDAAPPSTLGRHDSVRMAAEELMARGPPRRKGIPTRMRARGGGDENNSSSASSSGSSAHANASRSDGSITDGVLTGVGPHRAGPPSSAAVQAAPRGRAESASCLEREMRAMKLHDSDAATPPHATRAPLARVQPVAPQHIDMPSNQYPVVRATSPRPIRAAPPPAPQIMMDSPIPSRPTSRGPKDDNERRRRSVDVTPHPQQMMRAPSFGIPQIRSPPPDRKPPVPSILFDEDESARHGGAPPSVVVPSIMLPGGEEDEQSHNHAPHICVSSDEGAPTTAPSISISVSSSGLAQRSTTSQARTSSSSSSRATPFTVPEPASAPSVGSGAGCATCKKWIGGRVVHALSHTFHPDCFVCVHCSEPLEHVAFYEHDGQPYCHFDFHELFSKRCFHCRTPIVDQRYITINDVELVGSDAAQQQQERCYHDTHFFCANCGDPFLDPKVAASAAGADVLRAEIEDENGVVRYGGREFVVHKGYPYCEPCHVSLHKPRCKGCAKPIVDAEYLTALRAKWHVGCFACQRCSRPIDTDNFFVRDGEAYDEQCYKIKLRSEL